jgi:hypothetical protein
MAIDSSQPDIIIGTETWLTKDMNSSEFIPNDFEVFRRDRGSDPQVWFGVSHLLHVHDTVVFERVSYIDVDIPIQAV